MSIDKEAPNDGSSNLGYSAHLNLMSNDIGVSTGLSYDINPNISLNGRFGMSLNGTIDQSVDISYNLSQTKKIGVKFEREFKDLGDELNHSLVAIEYQHVNYAFKMPIYCYN